MTVIPMWKNPTLIRLPVSKVVYNILSEHQLFRAIKQRRVVIRYHRDQLGDDRCFLDDYRVWFMLSDMPVELLYTLPCFDEAMRTCRQFFTFRRSETRDPIPTPLDRASWDNDLKSMSLVQLRCELERLQEAIRIHRDESGNPRTTDDDRRLYRALPEQLSADFRLPPEEDFLGEALAPTAGCPSFWRSHRNCRTNKHDLSRWGPCV